ncbi:hypothetical protein CKO28_02720 [Rhodovibrio sodomensis]|uniref:Uncharacterized protein n=2 Tax=Rhodovibrio sodomensis TaxID=1088 RepID=A0ABS1DAI1_9PROT|nr:hypothetical protein [Rhodovibrio sodomensis]
MKIRQVKKTGFGCPTEWRGLAVVSGREPIPFKARYRGWSLSIGIDGATLQADSERLTARSDGIASWDEVADAAMQALEDHLLAHTD